MKLSDIAWLAGHWKNEDGTEEEFWLPPAGAMMLGLHRKINKAGPAFFEFLRIEETESGLTYWASPNGATPTPFKTRKPGHSEVDFQNPQHDFPQGIRYELQGETLVASIYGPSQGRIKTVEWRWKKG